MRVCVLQSNDLMRVESNIYAYGGLFPPVYLRPISGYSPLELGEVLSALAYLQSLYPLGMFDHLRIVILPMVMGRYNPSDGSIVNVHTGEYRDGMVLLSAASGSDQTKTALSDYLAHEFCHSLPDQEQLADHLSIDRTTYPHTGDNPIWQWRWKEILAEWVSYAMWSVPIENRTPAMPMPTPEQLAKIEKWFATRWSPTEASFVTEGDRYVLTITVQMGKTTARVNGKKVKLRMPPVVVPPGVTMMPLRDIAELLGFNVDWDQHTQTVTLTQEGLPHVL